MPRLTTLISSSVTTANLNSATFCSSKKSIRLKMLDPSMINFIRARMPDLAQVSRGEIRWIEQRLQCCRCLLGLAVAATITMLTFDTFCTEVANRFRPIQVQTERMCTRKEESSGVVIWGTAAMALQNRHRCMNMLLNFDIMATRLRFERDMNPEAVISRYIVWIK